MSKVKQQVIETEFQPSSSDTNLILYILRQLELTYANKNMPRLKCLNYRYTQKVHTLTFSAQYDLPVLEPFLNRRKHITIFTRHYIKYLTNLNINKPMV